MKISALKSIFFPHATKKKEDKTINLEQIAKEQNVSSLDCLSSYNQVLVDSRKEKAHKLLTKIVNDDSRTINVRTLGEYTLATSTPKKDSVWAETYFAINFDSQNNIKNIFGEYRDPYRILVYNPQGEIIKEYDGKEIQAMQHYKTGSVFVTKKLRDCVDWGSDKKSVEHTREIIDTLSRLFKDEKKYFVNEQDRKLFRAMHKPMHLIGKVGEIFTDQSFVSTSTDIKTPKEFTRKSEMPIMIIDFPKGARYIDADSPFNVSEINWKEKEYLLNRDSQFLITKVDKKNNLVQATYILTDEEKANLNEN